jgi:hypothetical protein
MRKAYLVDSEPLCQAISVMHVLACEHGDHVLAFKFQLAHTASVIGFASQAQIGAKGAVVDPSARALAIL